MGFRMGFRIWDPFQPKPFHDSQGCPEISPVFGKCGGARPRRWIQQQLRTPCSTPGWFKSSSFNSPGKTKFQLLQRHRGPRCSSRGTGPGLHLVDGSGRRRRLSDILTFCTWISVLSLSPSMLNSTLLQPCQSGLVFSFSS